MNQELDNIFNSAKKAMADDLRLQYYNAAQERNFYFRQLNNKANRQHAMFSGVPAGQQMNYDKYTFLPSMATKITQAISQQQENQDGQNQNALSRFHLPSFLFVQSIA